MQSKDNWNTLGMVSISTEYDESLGMEIQKPTVSIIAKTIGRQGSRAFRIYHTADWQAGSKPFYVIEISTEHVFFFVVRLVQRRQHKYL